MSCLAPAFDLAFIPPSPCRTPPDESTWGRPPAVTRRPRMPCTGAKVIRGDRYSSAVAVLDQHETILYIRFESLLHLKHRSLAMLGRSMILRWTRRRSRFAATLLHCTCYEETHSIQLRSEPPELPLQSAQRRAGLCLLDTIDGETTVVSVRMQNAKIPIAYMLRVYCDNNKY